MRQIRLSWKTRLTEQMAAKCNIIHKTKSRSFPTEVNRSVIYTTRLEQSSGFNNNVPNKCDKAVWKSYWEELAMKLTLPQWKFAHKFFIRFVHAEADEYFSDVYKDINVTVKTIKGLKEWKAACSFYFAHIFIVW